MRNYDHVNILMNRKYKIISIITVILTWVLPAQAQTWKPVGSGITYGISGIALIEQQQTTASFLVVHDNKKPDEPRLGWLRVTKQEASYQQIKWLSRELPIDLEAITPIPDQSNQFLALSSGGQLYHLQLNSDYQSAKILKVFSLPPMPSRSNFEGLALQKVNQVIILAWAHRGQDEEAGILYWSRFDLDSYSFVGPIQSTPLVTPLNMSNIRQVSDLKVDSSGAVFITSTTDPGNDGPFTSAFYLIGTFQVESQGENGEKSITFLSNQHMTPFIRLDYHKVEAVEFLSGEYGGLVFGTDDENFGSSVFLTW